jgi:hypothetical protein
MHALISNPAKLQEHIQQITGDYLLKAPVFPEHLNDIQDASAVMFLLGIMPGDNGQRPEPSLILNKRSQTVTQPGDLCCPGGGISPKLDTFMAKAMALPGFPMWCWPFWPAIQSRSVSEAEILRVLFFTSLRESYEEMRLNPFGVRFLGPLPTQQLVMFGRVIYPMVGWVSRQQHFRTNWEVDKIVAIPLRSLLDPGHYVQYQLDIQDPNDPEAKHRVYDAPSFVHQSNSGTEVLWGATCRMTLNFLELVFDFEVPTDGSLPVLKGMMDETYMNPKAKKTNAQHRTSNIDENK